MSPETQRQKKRSTYHYQPRRPQLPTREQIERIAAWIQPRYLAGWVMVMAWSGVRVMEAGTLRWSQVTLLPNGCAMLRVTHNKGTPEPRTHDCILMRPAIEHLPREHMAPDVDWTQRVKVPTPALRLLQEQGGVPHDWDGWVFPNVSGCNHMSYLALNEAWREALPGDCQHVEARDLRHWHATMLADRGFTTEQIGCQLRHFHRSGYVNIQHVVLVYGHPDARLALARIADAMAGVT